MLSENKIRFKGIQKMRAQLRVSTNFLTVPRKGKKYMLTFAFKSNLWRNFCSAMAESWKNLKDSTAFSLFLLC